MTEAEWLTLDDPTPMLKFLRRRWPRRKVRLFASEAVWPFFVDFFGPEDQAALPGELDRWADDRDSDTSGAALHTYLSLLAEVTGMSIDLARLFWDSDWLDAHRLTAGCEGADRRRYLAMLRDLAGNPFGPVAFDPAWRTNTAVSLAKQMYESRDFGAIPILADALQDAGCNNEDILSHCRNTSLTHVRGCWVVDLVLGKQ